MADEESPKIVNELFWLAKAAKIVEDSGERLDKAAERVASAMAWFWTIYSGATTAALALSGLRITGMWALLVAAPILPLFAAYVFATWASLPVSIGFNVLAPYDIKQAHEKAILAKRNRLRISLVLGGVTSVLVAAVAVGTILAGPPPEGRIAVALSPAAGKPALLVGGTVDAAEVAVAVTPKGMPAVEQVVPVAKGKPFSVAVPVPAAGSYDVHVAWKKDKQRTVVTQVVEP